MKKHKKGAIIPRKFFHEVFVWGQICALLHAKKQLDKAINPMLNFDFETLDLYTELEN